MRGDVTASNQDELSNFFMEGIWYFFKQISQIFKGMNVIDFAGFDNGVDNRSL